MENFKNKKIEEIKELLIEKKSEKEVLAQSILKGKEKDLSKLKKLRKEIARMQTAIKEQMEEKNA